MLDEDTHREIERIVDLGLGVTGAELEVVCRRAWLDGHSRLLVLELLETSARCGARAGKGPSMLFDFLRAAEAIMPSDDPLARVLKLDPDNLTTQ